MASEYTPFCPRYCHRSVLGIRSANKYYIQACVLGKDGGDEVDENYDDDEDLSPWQSHINRAIGTLTGDLSLLTAPQVHIRHRFRLRSTFNVKR
jgi:hypothetical protein